MNHICSILVALMTAVCMADFTFQTDDTTMTISSSSSNVTIFDRSTAHDFLASSRGLVFATGSSTQAFSTSAAASATPGEPGEVVIDAFVATLSVTVTVAIRAEPTHFVFRVLGCTAGASAQVPMLSTSCKTSGSYLSCASVDADFGVVVRELDRQHRPFASGSAGSVSVLWMTESFGSKVLMVASPMATIRQRLRDALIFENATLISGHGGPSAWNSSRSRESYVFADVSESNCNSWINFARGWGFGTLLFSHPYHSAGTYGPDLTLFPNGMAGIQSCINRVHSAGLFAGLVTKTGLIELNDPLVTPVPDARLRTDGSVQVNASGLDATSTKVYTATPPPSGWSTTWKYFYPPRAFIQIDSEIIEYEVGITEGFMRCTRGALGTTAAPHAAGATIKHLMAEGSFIDGDNTLLPVIAANAATMFNLGFDFILQEGAPSLYGGKSVDATVWEASFLGLTRPAAIESENMATAAWPFQSRAWAWPMAGWGLKGFVDLHARVNSQQAALLLPEQFGTWTIHGRTEDRHQQQLDDFEYLLAKAVSRDVGVSVRGLQLGSQTTARQADFLAALRGFEMMRRNGLLSDSVKTQLAVAGAEFHLLADATSWKLVPVSYSEVILRGASGGSFSVTNPHNSQQLRFRIQALYSAHPHNDSNAIELAHFQSTTEFFEPQAPSGVTVRFDISTEHLAPGTSTSGKITVSNSRTSRRGAYGVITRYYGDLDLTNNRALGMWVFGDGKGEVLNIQLGSYSGRRTLPELYVVVDFNGWRYIEIPFIERNPRDISKYGFPYGGYDAPFNDWQQVFVHPADWSKINELHIYVNYAPVGENCTVFLSPISALPVRNITISNPVITIGSTPLSITSTSITTDAFVEFNSPSDCRLFSGTTQSTVATSGATPVLGAGANTVAVSWTAGVLPEGVIPRVKVTVIALGAPIASGSINGTYWSSDHGGDEPSSDEGRQPVSCAPSVNAIAIVAIVITFKFFL